MATAPRYAETTVDPPASNAHDFCRRILELGDLDSKLMPPLDAAGQLLPVDPSGPALRFDRPARDPGLRMRGGGDKLPRPSELTATKSRQTCLARFAHHELMAVEYFAWALLRWPELPSPLRRGMLTALADEQRHCRLYLDRLAVLGGRFDNDDHSDYFWRHAPAIAASPAGPAAFLAAMGLTLEQANLDFTLTYRDGFTAAGDAESAAICQQVHDDEIAHVALAAHWIVRLAPTNTGTAAPDLDHYLASVPFPLGASRAKGRRFEARPRARAGLSPTFIEHVRTARSSQERGVHALVPVGEPWILPNLAAEEGTDWSAFPATPHARVAARLLSLLFAPTARRIHPGPDGRWTAESIAGDWPSELGPVPNEPVAPWLDTTPHAFAWLNTRSLAESLASGLPGQSSVRIAGPDPDCVAALHDKRFAVDCARELDLDSPSLDPLILVLEPEACLRVDETIDQLSRALEAWPPWTGQRFTLKPRFGSSGRGRTGGEAHVDVPAVRGALGRLARRGGAIFEPWLERTCDLSVALHIPAGQTTATLLASFEMLATRSGVFRGHCGEIDAQGRITSGDPEDERLRRGASSVAEQAAIRGFVGPCGVDAFRYREGDRSGWRGAVEFNARPTMGLVSFGLIRRALPRLRRTFPSLAPSACGFLVTLLDGSGKAETDAQRDAILAGAGEEAFAIELAPGWTPAEPRPLLFFGRDRKVLRESHRAAIGC